ncbi:MAG: transcription elongation factor GreA [Holosporales bacterium]|jgi:transcription elongation factor GreA|nr:transcription elongation factor GreA [Holosporales bacterium]
MEKIPMTLKGYQKLQEKIRYLKNVERPQIIESIASAMSMGDLSENAEYDAAKNKQGLTEANILYLEDKLSKAEVIDPSKINSKSIKFGATIELLDEETNAISKFQIVGSDEADIKNGFLPITSPIAKALIGREEGNSIEVNTPNGLKYYEIVRVSYL